MTKKYESQGCHNVSKKVKEVRKHHETCKRKNIGKLKNKKSIKNEK